MNGSVIRVRRFGFTMIEVLTVGAIAALILALSLPAFSWMAQSREREAAAEAISAQIMAARAHAVQFRTYAGIAVQQITELNMCLSRSTGRIHLIRVRPQDVDNPTNNKLFYHIPERSPVGIVRGVGFARGFKPDPGNGQTELTNSSRFFIVFGPDGILRKDWEVRQISAFNGTNVNSSYYVRDNNAGMTYRYSVGAFGVYDDTRLNEIADNDPTKKLRLIYGVNGSISDPDPPANAVVQDNILVRRYFINPATGLAVNDFDLQP